jgi:hypothetical protein
MQIELKAQMKKINDLFPMDDGHFGYKQKNS